MLNTCYREQTAHTNTFIYLTYFARPFIVITLETEQFIPGTTHCRSVKEEGTETVRIMRRIIVLYLSKQTEAQVRGCQHAWEERQVETMFCTQVEEFSVQERDGEIDREIERDRDRER